MDINDIIKESLQQMADEDEEETNRAKVKAGRLLGKVTPAEGEDEEEIKEKAGMVLQKAKKDTGKALEKASEAQDKLLNVKMEHVLGAIGAGLATINKHTILN